MANRTVSVSLKAEIADFMGKMGTAARGAKQFGDELGGLGKKNPQQLNDVAMAVGGVGASLLAVAGYAVKTAMDFDKQMSAVSAATNANVGDMARLREAALEAGKATTFSATEAAKGQTELAKAGVSTADILGGGLSGALDLAAAGQMEVADSAELAATAMTQFGLSGKDVPHIADLLAAGAGKAQGSVKDMGQALNQSGLVAAQFGLSIEDATGTLAMFANAGLTGSDAGTSFKTMLMMLANPSKAAAKTMEELGIAAYDSGGAFVGVTSLAEQLKTKMAGLSEEQRNAALATIFGADAIRAASVMYKNGGAGVDEWRNKVNDAGFASETAAKLTDNLAGDLERLKGSLETLAIEAGSGANGGLRLLVQGLDGVVSGFSNLPGPVQTALTVLAGVGGAGLLAVAGLLKVKQTADDAMTALRDMGPAGGKAADGLSKVGKAIGAATIAGLGIALAYEGTKLFIEFLNRDVEGATRNVDEMGRALQKLGETGQVAGELKAAFGSNLRGLTQGFKDFNHTQAEMSTGLKESKNGIQELGRAIAAGNAEQAGLNDKQHKRNNDFTNSVKAMDGALTKMVTNGGVTQAKMAYEALAETWTAAGLPLSQLSSLLPGYTKATGDAAAASGQAAAGFGSAEQNARSMASGMEAAVAAGQSLKDMFDQLNGGFINSQLATIAVEDAVDKLAESFKQNGLALNENKDAFDLNTQKGRENAAGMITVAQKARDVAQAKYEETGSLDVAKGAYDGYIGKLRQTLGQAGLTEAQVDSLVSAISQMPPLKSTTIQVNGVGGAIGQVQTLSSYINSLRDRNISITTKIATYYANTGQQPGAGSRMTVPSIERWGGVTEHAASGLLKEAGTYTPNGPARYAFAEPATQGEAFIPRNGDRLRSLGILTKAAGWYGANISTGGIPAGGVRASTQTTRIIIDGTGVLEGLRREVYVRGGNVQQVVGRTGR